MTTGKRALIVDDSRSARVILSRMLEQHGMTVDTAESAEQALEYLQQNRPDVIFMDHLMPGMDGFQAVQAIKSDVSTATIPLMMYTSQEGELYVSQARALGAVGVLPKTVRPVDVSRVLYQLNLLPDRRQLRSALFERPPAARAELPGQAAASAIVAAAEPPAEPGTNGQLPLETPPRGAPAQPSLPADAPGWSAGPIAVSELQSSLRQSMQQLVKDQLAEQRRFLLATFEAFARRLGTEMKELAPKSSASPVVETLPVEPARHPVWPVIVTALVAALPALVLGALYWRALDDGRETGRQLAALQAEVQKLGAQTASIEKTVATMPAVLPPLADAAGVDPAAASAQARPASPATPAAAVAIEYVPFGETPFANARLERLRSIVAPLEARKFRGRIVVESYVGDFCLTGSPSEGFEVADPALPFKKCELVGNPFDDALSPAQRQSVDFANFVATIRQRSGGAISVEEVNAGRRNPVEYPVQTETGTAGAWNTIAAQNNRVEFRVVAAD